MKYVIITLTWPLWNFYNIIHSCENFASGKNSLRIFKTKSILLRINTLTYGESKRLRKTEKKLRFLNVLLPFNTFIGFVPYITAILNKKICYILFIKVYLKYFYARNISKRPHYLYLFTIFLPSLLELL